MNPFLPASCSRFATSVEHSGRSNVCSFAVEKTFYFFVYFNLIRDLFYLRDYYIAHQFWSDQKGDLFQSRRIHRECRSLLTERSFVARR
jgi:hypothetical protein